jgi:putative membrane protein
MRMAQFRASSSWLAMASDPRVFFAAERTLLAWVRTGLTVMAFGFVVARFGLFLRLLSVEKAGQLPAGHDLSNPIGIALVLIGVACMALGAIQHRRFVATLPALDVPRSSSGSFPLVLALMLGALGLVLAVYLAL